MTGEPSLTEFLAAESNRSWHAKLTEPNIDTSGWPESFPDEASFKEWLNAELMRSYKAAVEAAFPCPLCGQLGEHDQAACDAKMAAWKPTGILTATIDFTTPYQPASPSAPAAPPRDTPEMTDPERHVAEHVYATFVDDLPYCGCGDPGAAMTLVVQILNLTPAPAEVGDVDRSGEIRTLCGTPAATQFVLAALDGAGLTEHGGSLYSAWLTGRGAWLLWAVGRLGGVEGLDGRLDDVGYPDCWVDGGCPESHRVVPRPVASGG